MTEPVKRATAHEGKNAVARFTGSISSCFIRLLGLAPQALFCHPLRGFDPGNEPALLFNRRFATRVRSLKRTGSALQSSRRHAGSIPERIGSALQSSMRYAGSILETNRLRSSIVDSLRGFDLNGYGRVAEEDDAGWFRPRLMIIFTSTRRFCWRPAAVVLSATDSVLP